VHFLPDDCGPDRPTRLSRERSRRSFCATPLHVLSDGALAKCIEPAILSARVSAARVALEAARHLRNPQSIDELFDKATRHLRGARSALAYPATVPPSFRNRRTLAR
jgi:hypothetical protein